MSILRELESAIANADAIRDAGVPTVSMALLDKSGATSAHVITAGTETYSTLYQACSISKSITALAIAKLIDTGVISYDDRIIDHLPQHRLERLGKLEKHMNLVTVGSLISHTSGLSQHGFPGYLPADVPSPEDIFQGRPPANTPRISFSSFPGAQLSYSGGGFLLLQIYLEHVLQLPFHELMQKLVLAPLGMTRSHFGDLNVGEHDYASAYMTGTLPAKSAYHVFPEMAAAGLWTTPTDLLKATIAVQHSLHRSDGFLSTETARRMLTTVAPNQSNLSMAMGWGSDQHFFGHAGDNDPGYMTYVFASHRGVVNQGGATLAPKHEDVAFAIMTNSVEGFGVIRKIVAAVFYLDGWSPVAQLPGNFGSMNDLVPYPLMAKPVEGDHWKAWIGKWDDRWLLTDDNGVPKLSLGETMQPVRLLLGAEVVESSHGSKIISFVVQDCSIAVRLLQKDTKRCLEIVQSETVQVLKTQTKPAVDDE